MLPLGNMLDIEHRSGYFSLQFQDEAKTSSISMQLAACFHRTHAEHRLTTGIDAAHNDRTPYMYSSCDAEFPLSKNWVAAKAKRKTSFYVWFWIIKSEFDIFETNLKCYLKKYHCFFRELLRFGWSFTNQFSLFVINHINIIQFRCVHFSNRFNLSNSFNSFSKDVRPLLAITINHHKM